MVTPLRVAIRGLVVALLTAVLMAFYVFMIAPHLLDRDNMVAPLLFVGLPLFFVHSLLLATVCGSLVCAARAPYTDPSSRGLAGYAVLCISLVATAALGFLYVYFHVLGR